MKEECGVAGIILPGDRPQSNTVAFKLYYALYALQHRGQESTGIMVYDGTSSHSIKGMGLVPDVYNNEYITILLSESKKRDINAIIPLNENLKKKLA